MQRLLEIIVAARAATRVETLDELERVADDLLAKALVYDSNHALSGRALAATSSWVCPLGQAIVERRIVLSAPGRAPFRVADRRRVAD